MTGARESQWKESWQSCRQDYKGPNQWSAIVCVTRDKGVSDSPLSRVVLSNVTVQWSSKTPNERAPFKEGQKGNTEEEEEEERKEKVPDIGTHNFKNRKNETKVTINNNTINRLPTRMYTHSPTQSAQSFLHISMTRFDFNWFLIAPVLSLFLYSFIHSTLEVQQ